MYSNLSVSVVVDAMDDVAINDDDADDDDKNEDEDMEASGGDDIKDMADLVFSKHTGSRNSLFYFFLDSFKY